MVKESIFIVNNTADITEGFDRAIPGSWSYGFSFWHVNNINNRVVVSWEGFRLATVDDVEQIDIIIPGADLNRS